ncbi:MAG: metallophosphoesterase [Burkholderiales bacterium]|nr:metallophosphoesterase [Anaerolineae bacterium]
MSSHGLADSKSTTTHPSTIEANPMERGLLHNMLTYADSLQALPNFGVALALILNAALVGVCWAVTQPLEIALLAAGLCLTASAVDWGLLWALPRTGRSFGPEKPSALALSALRAIVLSALGLFFAPLWLGLVLMLAVSITVYYSTWIEPFALGVTRERLTARGWKAAATTPPLRVLHIGDIHVERVTQRERRLNALIKELKPDIIVFSGDFVNISYKNDPTAEAAVREVISEWQAPLGVYCVPGTSTVESVERVQEFVKGMDNLKLLANRWLSINTPSGAFHILGMVTTHNIDVDRKAFQRMMLSAPKGGFRLLLAHAPDIAPEADAAGMDLYVAGHTHGGQIRLPFIGAVFTASHLGRRFAMGRHDLKNITVYTTRGVGLEGLGAPRARFLCPPEIVLWEIGGAVNEKLA